MNPLSHFDPDEPYPESDGQPMAENTEQYEWLVKIKENLEILFRRWTGCLHRRRPVLVPGSRSPDHRPVAPDVMVVIGRPKGRRGSYRQWEEGGVAPQVVFEMLSPANSAKEMADKRASTTATACRILRLRPQPERPAHLAAPKRGGVRRRLNAGGSSRNPMCGVGPARGFAYASPSRPRPWTCSIRQGNRFSRPCSWHDAREQETERATPRALARAEQEAARAEHCKQRGQPPSRPARIGSRSALRALGLDPDALED